MDAILGEIQDLAGWGKPQSTDAVPLIANLACEIPEIMAEILNDAPPQLHMWGTTVIGSYLDQIFTSVINSDPAAAATFVSVTHDFRVSTHIDDAISAADPAKVPDFISALVANDNTELAAELLADMDIDAAAELLASMDASDVATLVASMNASDVATLVASMDASDAAPILADMDPTAAVPILLSIGKSSSIELVVDIASHSPKSLQIF